MKTIREHWLDLAKTNPKLSEWLMKQPLVSNRKMLNLVETEWNALFQLDWETKNYGDIFAACYNRKSWQPLLDALPELREGEVSEEFSLLKHTLKNGEFDYKPTSVQPHPTGSTRRSEILQLVAAMTMNKSLVWTPKDITDAVKQAILLQSEIDQQLNQR